MPQPLGCLDIELLLYDVQCTCSDSHSHRPSRSDKGLHSQPPSCYSCSLTNGERGLLLVHESTLSISRLRRETTLTFGEVRTRERADGV